MLKRFLGYCVRFGLTMQVIKTIIAAVASWYIAAAIMGHHFSYFAPLAAVLVIQVTIADSLEKGLTRVLGIIIGALLTVLITPITGQNPLSLGLVLLIGMGGATALKINPLITSQIGVSSVMIMNAVPISAYATGRIFETIIGAIVAVAVQIIIRPESKLPNAIKINVNICLQLAERMREVSELLGDAIEDAQETRLPIQDKELLNWMHNLNDSYNQAQKSLKYNVVYRKDTVKLSNLYEQMDAVQQMIMAVSGVNYALQKIPVKDLKRLGIEEVLISTADCILTFGKIIRHATPVRMERIQRQLAKCYDDQVRLYEMNMDCYHDVDLHTEVGRLLSDLHRIVQQIEHAEELSELEMDFSDKWKLHAVVPAKFRQD